MLHSASHRPFPCLVAKQEVWKLCGLHEPGHTRLVVAGALALVAPLASLQNGTTPSVQNCAPVEQEYLPAGHARQKYPPARMLNLPDGHAMQVAKPPGLARRATPASCGVYWPAAHFAHVPANCRYSPKLHTLPFPCAGAAGAMSSSAVISRRLLAQ